MMSVDRRRVARCGVPAVILALVVASMGISGCDARPVIDGDRCVPGRAESCRCPGGASGRRLCGPDGRFRACTCADVGREPDAGGLGCPTDPGISGTTHYVAPDGASDGSGSEQDPIDLASANAAVEPGDEVVLLSGAYTGRIQPSSSGSATDPIVYRSQTPHGARLERSDGNSVAIDLQGVDHVRVRGFTLDTGSARWVRVEDCSDIVLRDLIAEDHTGVGPPFVVTASDQVALLDSNLRNTDKYYLATFRDVERVAIAGNAFGATKHAGLEVTNSTAVVVRANAFHNPAGFSFAVRENRRIVFEDNLVANAVDGPGVHRSRSILGGDHVIARFNRLIWNWGTPLWTASNDGRTVSDIYLYHNVFDRAVSHSTLNGAGIRVRRMSGPMERVVVKNNAFTRLGQNDSRDHVWTRNIGERSVGRFVQNAFWAGSDASANVIADRTRYAVSEVDEAVDFFADSLEVEPGFRSIETFDHRLAEGSELVDRAVPLTRTVSEGSGTSLQLENAYYLFDGWNISDERGDRISVGRADRRARIEDIDYETNTVQLSSALEWSEGDPVGFPWSEEGPDIGVWERGTPARRGVGIERSVFVGEVGEPVAFGLVEHGGIEAEAARWRLGDGTAACGGEIEHAFDEPGAYPVRVVVEDAAGDVHRGGDLVLINGEGRRVDTLDYNRRVIDEVVCEGGEMYGDDVGRGDEGDFVCNR